MQGHSQLLEIMTEATSQNRHKEKSLNCFNYLKFSYFIYSVGCSITFLAGFYLNGAGLSRNSPGNHQLLINSTQLTKLMNSFVALFPVISLIGG